MSGTRRVPLARPPAVKITPRALDLFVEMERARRARRRADDCAIDAPSGYCTTDCRACRAWWDAHAALQEELRLPPWQWPCLPRNPYPPGSPKAREWRAGTEQKDLWDFLNKARRAAVVATASSSQKGPHAELVAGQEVR
jgi:hypothetical protein